MKIKKIIVSGVGGIKELKLEFDEHFNVICGANGIGKTTILNIIADAFANTWSLLKRNSIYSEGHYTILFSDMFGKVREKKFQVKEFNPITNDSGRHSSDETKYVMYFGTNRMINYQQLDAIPKDSKRTNYDSGSLFKEGIPISDLKGWFDNRYVFSDKRESMTYVQKCNFDIAKKAFGLLDNTIEFKSVDPGSLDIMLKSSRGDIYFEYLSAGYKTCVYIVLGIMKEIEFRFSEPYINVNDFSGVILIDEIDLHLHPAWQARLITALKEIFPKAQFIVTTHSPSVLQSIDTKEIIPLTMDMEDNIVRKELELGDYGLQGWTIEEILRDVMEMPSTTSAFFEKIKSNFDKAMDEENVVEIKKNYEILRNMLHPNSTVKKLLEIQMAGLEE